MVLSWCSRWPHPSQEASQSPTTWTSVLPSVPSSACSACLAEYHRLGGLNNGNLFSIVLEVGSPRSVCQQHGFVMRSLLPTGTRLPLCCVLTWPVACVRVRLLSPPLLTSTAPSDYDII